MEVKYSLSSNCSHEIFLVKPDLSSSNMRIFNPKTKKWIGSNDSWLDSPVLSHTIKAYLPKNHSKFKLTILRISNGTTFYTPELHFWVNESSQSVLNYVSIQQISESSSSQSPAVLNRPQNINNFVILFLPLVFILFGFMIVKRCKIARWIKKYITG